MNAAAWGTLTLNSGSEQGHPFHLACVAETTLRVRAECLGEFQPSYLGRITPRRIMGDTTWSEIWKFQSVGSLLALNSSSNPPI